MAFREVRFYPPERVKAVRRRDGDDAAEQMIQAIALDRAREMGARIGKPKK